LHKFTIVIFVIFFLILFCGGFVLFTIRLVKCNRVNNQEYKINIWLNHYLSSIYLVLNVHNIALDKNTFTTGLNTSSKIFLTERLCALLKIFIYHIFYLITFPFLLPKKN
jgi:cell division protein YceG involved in septum cleavage